MFDKRNDAASYDGHAQFYDDYIRVLSEPLAEQICALAEIKPGDHVLDVGTGSGVAARRATVVVGKTGNVQGIDLSVGMIETAKQSVENWEVKPLFQVMDAESLKFPDASFDAVICLCAVRHFPDLTRAIGEMRRVLKPGGRLVVSFGYARPITFLGRARHAANRINTALINPLQPRVVGPGLLLNLAERFLPPAEIAETDWGNKDPQGTLVRQVEASGLEKVAASWRGHDVEFESATAFWRAQTTIVTAVRKRIIDAPPASVDELRNAFLKKTERVRERGGKLIYPYGAFYVSGRQPI